MDGSEEIQAFAYERKGNSAVIRRCFSRDTKATVPGMIDGLPVTELAPYAFSAHMDQQQLEQSRDDLGARRRRLQALTEHFLHVAAHATAAARVEMNVTAVVGFIVEGIEQEARHRACGRKALLQAAAEHWPRDDDAQHNVVLAELAYSMRAGGIEQEDLVLSKRERRTIDDLRRSPSIDIADFDIIVHVFRHRIKARVANNR